MELVSTSSEGDHDSSLVKALLKNISNIPADISGDVFGKVYEYFLGKFALKEGQGGGEFFTPTSVVRLMVEMIEPYGGLILDPACGSGGMFVQSADFVKEHRKAYNDTGEHELVVHGVEKEKETVKIARMNMFLNGLRNEIVNANSYYDDPFDTYGHFDYVMANPPFNVDDVNLDKVKCQKRFSEYGIPQNKSKKTGKAKDELVTVPNANYLWINLFATALKPQGRAALVMPNSASDARNTEADIRQRLIESGIISCMLSLPRNMFYTVTLPATLWFFDKARIDDKHILFIDARNIFRQIDRAHREFTPEQIRNIACIRHLYQGDTDYMVQLLAQYDADKDGVVDCLLTYLAGPSETTGGSSDYLKNKCVSGNSYSTCGVYKINTTIFANEMYYDSNKRKIIEGIGTTCHEFSHALGLPDFYYCDNTIYFGLDYWSVMDYGLYGANSSKIPGSFPVGYTAYEKEFMGWTTIEELTEG